MICHRLGSPSCCFSLVPRIGRDAHDAPGEVAAQKDRVGQRCRERSVQRTPRNSNFRFTCAREDAKR